MPFFKKPTQQAAQPARVIVKTALDALSRYFDELNKVTFRKDEEGENTETVAERGLTVLKSLGEKMQEASPHEHQKLDQDVKDARSTVSQYRALPKNDSDKKEAAKKLAQAVAKSDFKKLSGNLYLQGQLHEVYETLDSQTASDAEKLAAVHHMYDSLSKAAAADIAGSNGSSLLGTIMQQDVEFMGALTKAQSLLDPEAQRILEGDKAATQALIRALIMLDLSFANKQVIFNGKLSPEKSESYSRALGIIKYLAELGRWTVDDKQKHQLNNAISHLEQGLLGLAESPRPN